MKKILFVILFVVLFSGGLYAEEKLKTENGTKEIFILSGELFSENNQWKLKTEQDIFSLDFAPENYLNENNIQLEPRENFHVTGFQEGVTFLVTNFLQSDSLIVLRDQDGTPLWTTEKPTNPHYVVDASKCIGCRLCVNNCPVDAIECKNGQAVIDAEKCINCGICKVGNRSNYKGCPVDAIDSSENTGK